MRVYYPDGHEDFGIMFLNDEAFISASLLIEVVPYEERIVDKLSNTDFLRGSDGYLYVPLKHIKEVLSTVDYGIEALKLLYSYTKFSRKHIVY